MQALRGVACLMVVMYHTLQASAGEPAIRAWPNGSAGVDLFFVISGFVMLGSTRRLVGKPGAASRFLRARAVRLVPLYWLLTVVKYAIATMAPGSAPHTRASAWNLFASLCFLPSRDLAGQIRPVLPVGWSLNFEVFFYALFAVVLARRWPAWSLVPALMLVAAAGFFHQDSWPAPLFLANGLVLEFAAGMGVCAAMLRGWLPSPRLAVALLAAGSLLLLVTPLAGPWRFLAWGVPAAAILLAALALENRFGAKLPRPLLAAGDASYAIYLVHPFVVALVAGRGWPGALLAVPLSVAAGLLVHAYVDTPLRGCAGKVLQQNVAFPGFGAILRAGWLEISAWKRQRKCPVATKP